MFVDSDLPNLDNLASLIRVIRQREQLYFELLQFINKNIQSSSNQVDQIGIFNRYLNDLRKQDIKLRKQQQEIYNLFFILPKLPKQQLKSNFHLAKNNKQVLRLSARLIQILQSSLQKSSSTIFNNSGKLSLQFLRFKKLLNKITYSQTIDISQFVTTFINYSANKFNRQSLKVQKYLIKLQSGQHINLRDMYCKGNSDVSSPQQKVFKQHYKDQSEIQICVKKQIRQLSLRKPTRTSLRKTNKSNPRQIKNKQSSSYFDQKDQLNQKSNKLKNAGKLYKFYQLLELNKKQFMQDYVYEKNYQQGHAQKLLNSLLQRNKTIKTQISDFVDKNQNFLQNLQNLNKLQLNFKTSDDQQNFSKQQLLTKQSNQSRLSIRVNFLISKRKSSLHLDSSSDKKMIDPFGNQDCFIKTIKNFSPRKKTSYSQNKSSKMYIVKPPIVFEQQVIPQIGANSHKLTGRMNLSGRGKQKRGQYIRLKNKNNPVPLEKSFIGVGFQYSKQRF